MIYQYRKRFFGWKNTNSFLLKYTILIISVFLWSNSVNLLAQPMIAGFVVSDSVSIPASTNYKTGRFQRFVYGDVYRKSWRTPVKMPVFDMKTTFSHLKPVKKGGGMSTKSLRLEDETGRQYVLRSVYKNGRAGVPDKFKGTVYEDILQDLRVGAHPYGALPVPTLADAAGIYHTNPAIYFLPVQEELGEYKDDFGGELYLFEEYSNEGWEHLESFGNTQKIIGYDTMLEKIEKSTKHRIDQKWVLKSRLFDLFIGDYDRHDDQWRWAAFEQEANDTIIYRPIPRDRDQALYNIHGVLPWLLSRDFLAIQQHPFKPKIQNLKGFASNAKHFDRTWMTGLSWSDWEAVAQELETALTDEVIDTAFETWPEEIYKLNAPKLIQTLKGRKGNMQRHALELYLFLAKYVDVVGTEKAELFDVEHQQNGNVRVKVFNLSQEGKKNLFYDRTFKPNETKEIRLYGLDGKDEFNFHGTEKNQILIRVVGGKKMDTVLTNDRSIKGKKIIVYDDLDGIQLPNEPKIANRTSTNKKYNEYDRLELQYDSYLPLVNFGITQDDGVFLGGGAIFTRYGYKKRPYGSKHKIDFQFSNQTNGLRIGYDADFTQLFGRFNFNPNISFDRPIIFNFYGLGNNTVLQREAENPEEEDEQFHWVRLKRFKVEPLIKRISKNRQHQTRFGPFYQNVIVLQRFDRISSQPDFFNDDTYLGNKDFIGFLVKHQFDSVDDLDLEGGWKYNLGITYYRNIGQNRGYARLEGNVSRFIHFDAPIKMVLGGRVGAATLTNDDYFFFHNNHLGGNNYLRGFHNNRYAGTSLAYANLDVRISLFYFKNAIAPGEIGLSAGFDTGRVWYPNANEGGWKTGFSPDIWWTPYKFTAINIFYTYTGNGEDNALTIRTGFYF